MTVSAFPTYWICWAECFEYSIHNKITIEKPPDCSVDIVWCHSYINSLLYKAKQRAAKKHESGCEVKPMTSIFRLPQKTHSGWHSLILTQVRDTSVCFGAWIGGGVRGGLGMGLTAPFSSSGEGDGKGTRSLMSFPQGQTGWNQSSGRGFADLQRLGLESNQGCTTITSS